MILVRNQEKSRLVCSRPCAAHALALSRAGEHSTAQRGASGERWSLVRRARDAPRSMPGGCSARWHLTCSCEPSFSTCEQAVRQVQREEERDKRDGETKRQKQRQGGQTDTARETILRDEGGSVPEQPPIKNEMGDSDHRQRRAHAGRHDDVAQVVVHVAWVLADNLAACHNRFGADFSPPFLLQLPYPASCY